jgi:aminopeptidase-like protein
MSGPLGTEMIELIDRLYPLCRSLTGNGVRETLRIVAEHVPLQLHEVPTGTPVFDWTVPPEWNIRDAWIKGADGRRIVDFRESNLHVVGYSAPVSPRGIDLAELREHLHALPERPDAIPYRTSFYEENWGFCVTQKQLESLTDPEYEVCIDSSLEEGSLTYAECLIPGETDREVLVSVHVCHPSLCNDNLSGIVVSALLARELQGRRNRLSYRFLYVPGTIGSITWLARNRERVHRVRHGLTLTCLGDARGFTYKRTLRGDAEIDRAVEYVLASRGEPHEVIDFHPYGYDERQYNSPGFRLPVGSLMRGQHGRFPEYHTSDDDRDLMDARQLEGAFETALAVFAVLEHNHTYRNLSPYGEPQLGRRGLYRSFGVGEDPEEVSMAALWLLQFADGDHDLLDIATRSGMAWGALRRAVELLEENGILQRVLPE